MVKGGFHRTTQLYLLKYTVHKFLYTDSKKSKHGDVSTLLLSSNVEQFKIVRGSHWKTGPQENRISALYSQKTKEDGEMQRICHTPGSHEGDERMHIGTEGGITNQTVFIETPKWVEFSAAVFVCLEFYSTFKSLLFLKKTKKNQPFYSLQLLIFWKNLLFPSSIDMQVFSEFE
jgi:hypothetical protein